MLTFYFRRVGIMTAARFRDDIFYLPLLTLMFEESSKHGGWEVLR